MEAVWTRYFPLSAYVRDLITSNKLGLIHRVTADLSNASSPATTFADGQSRMVNMSLAGGALLDLGVYSLTWLFQTLYTTQPPSQRSPPAVMGTAMDHFKTGADVQTSMILTFPQPDGRLVHGIATTGLFVATDPDSKGSAGPAVRVQGELGELQVFHPAFRPTKTKVVMKGEGVTEEKEWPHPGPGKGSGFFNGFGSDLQPEGEGQGMFWEADEAGLALLEGRKEGRLLDLEESVLIMEVMDEVRRQGGLTYPENIESTEFPLKLE